MQNVSAGVLILRINIGICTTSCEISNRSLGNHVTRRENRAIWDGLGFICGGSLYKQTLRGWF